MTFTAKRCATVLGGLILCSGILNPPSAVAFEGLIAAEIPPGGDVIVPGEFPIQVASRLNVMFTGLDTPQSITLKNVDNAKTMSEVRIYASHEKKVRVLRLQPGSSVVYNFKNLKPVRVRVVTGNVNVSSLNPLKVQR